MVYEREAVAYPYGQFQIVHRIPFKPLMVLIDKWQSQEFIADFVPKVFEFLLFHLAQGIIAKLAADPQGVARTGRTLTRSCKFSRLPGGNSFLSRRSTSSGKRLMISTAKASPRVEELRPFSLE